MQIGYAAKMTLHGYACNNRTHVALQ